MNADAHLEHIVYATAAARVTIGEDGGAGATCVAGTAAILLPGVVGASPTDWDIVTVSIFFHSSSRRIRASPNYPQFRRNGIVLLLWLSCARFSVTSA